MSIIPNERDTRYCRYRSDVLDLAGGNYPCVVNRGSAVALDRPDTQTTERDDLLRSLRVLASLVRDEYPAGYSLVDIVRTWTVADDRDLSALLRVERLLISEHEPGLGLVDDLGQVGQVEPS